MPNRFQGNSSQGSFWNLLEIYVTILQYYPALFIKFGNNYIIPRLGKYSRASLDFFLGILLCYSSHFVQYPLSLGEEKD